MALSRLWLNILTSKRRIAFTATAFVRVVGGLRKKKPGFGYRAERGEPFAQLTHDFIAAREANNARARNFNNFCHIPDGGQERIQLIARSGTSLTNPREQVTLNRWQMHVAGLLAQVEGKK